jgi:hypothetical protein
LAASFIPQSSFQLADHYPHNCETFMANVPNQRIRCAAGQPLPAGAANPERADDEILSCDISDDALEAMAVPTEPAASLVTCRVGVGNC